MKTKIALLACAMAFFLTQEAAAQYVVYQSPTVVYSAPAATVYPAPVTTVRTIPVQTYATPVYQVYSAPNYAAANVYPGNVLSGTAPTYRYYAPPTAYAPAATYAPGGGVFARLMEFERRKNAWLRQTFLGRP